MKSSTPSASPPGPWIPDLGNGRYRNPVLHADYSDPDVIRVGDDFYLIASSFNCMPGIPILHSKDLVNWTLLNHVYPAFPLEKHRKPVHGHGSWAPAIRHHNGLFHVYFCTPHEGLFVARAKDPAGVWDFHCVEAVEMWEDPCPFWDDDGAAYLVRSKLTGGSLFLHRMSPDGLRLLDNGELIFSNLETQRTIEGPKFLKKDGYYYILAPAGGVPTGWQTVLRSRSIRGPYEERIVLHQGSTGINGPHQGGLVDTPGGEWWFMHFQSRGAWGRVVHLQPVRWKDGWPLMGGETDGIGEPVLEWTKPDVGHGSARRTPQTSDDFNGESLGPQWQWPANPEPEWYSLTERPGHLRLYAVKNFSQEGNLWFVPNLLLQKFPAPVFMATTEVTPRLQLKGERCGLVIMGEKWSYLAVVRRETGLELAQFNGGYAVPGDATACVHTIPAPEGALHLRVRVGADAVCRFFWSRDGQNFESFGQPFTAVPGVWIGAKVGLFCLNPNIHPGRSHADFSRFTVE